MMMMMMMMKMKERKKRKRKERKEGGKFEENCYHIATTYQAPQEDGTAAHISKGSKKYYLLLFE